MSEKLSERQMVVDWLQAAAVTALDSGGTEMARENADKGQANIDAQVALALMQAARRIEGGAHVRLADARTTPAAKGE